MNGNIKEIHVSVRTHKDRNGNLSAAAIYLDGRPVAKGVYTSKEPPPGWRWDKFVAAALRNEGHGVAVFHEDDKKRRPSPTEEVKASG